MYYEHLAKEINIRKSMQQELQRKSFRIIKILVFKDLKCFFIMRLMHVVVHIVSYLQLQCKNIEIPIITVIIAVTVILKLGSNRQV